MMISAISSTIDPSAFLTTSKVIGSVILITRGSSPSP
jgi:hypothetical protein